MRKLSTGGPWGLGLALAGAGFGAYGAAYVVPVPGDDVPQPLVELSVYVPLWFWAGLWLLAGGWSIWRGLHPPQIRRDALPLILVHHLWGSAYMVWWLILGLRDGIWSRDWRGWVLFGTVSTLMIVWSRLVNPPALLHLTPGRER